MDDKQTVLGRYLKSLRKANALTLRAVEDKVGISNAFLSQLESSKVKQPSPVALYKLAELYGVAYEDLMEKAGYPVPEARTTTPGNANRLFHRLGHLTKEEEEALLEYLSFIRSRSEKRRGRS